MRITGARVFTPEGCFEQRDICAENGRFVEDAAGEVVDASGLMAIPGLIDVHLHACMGQDFCNGTAEAIRTMARYQASEGVLAICPATMTYPEEKLESIADAAAAWVAEGSHAACADLVGINMEGPFISPKRIGAQNPAYVQPCNLGMFQRLQQRAGGLFKLVDVAPEEPGALDFIRAVAQETTVSVAHTCATVDQAAAAFEAGARQCTHLWNAMTPLHHRDPGVIGAAADRDDVRVELICDGIHVHPSAIRLTFRLFAGRVVMISDSMEATGLTDGAYELGGQEVFVQGKLATLADGTIAGSVTNLFNCLRFAVHEVGIPLEEALTACTLTPAQAIGADGDYGSIACGKVANLVLVDDELNIHACYLHGELLDR